MAIKIRKQGDGDEEPEGEEPSQESTEVTPEASDPFLRSSTQTISWFAENRNLVFGGIVAAIVAGIGIYAALSYTRQQQIAASTQLSRAIQAAEVPVDGSPVMKAYSQQQNVTAPENTHGSDPERWQKVYDSASKTLDSYSSGNIAQGARLMKASAALRLDKASEAVTLYETYLEGSHPKDNLAIVHYGLATAYGAAGKLDEALKTYDKLKKADDDYGTLVKYQKAILLEHEGKTKRATKLYNEILENDPKSSYKQSIERRLALM